jgi:hypothetical protein
VQESVPAYAPEVRIPIKIAAIGAPNTTQEFTVDILEDFIGETLEGQLVYFDVTERAGAVRRTKRVVCQLFDMQSHNRFHEDSRFKGMIKVTGFLPYLSGVADTKTATLKVMGVFLLNERGHVEGPTLLNTPPSSGTAVYQADAAMVREIAGSPSGLFYLGYLFGSADTPAPALLRHFGPDAEGGMGEALMTGVFGQSGCGKSVMSAIMVAAYAANPRMGQLIIDPQGEFAQDRFAQGTRLDFSFHRLLAGVGRRPLALRIENVALEKAESFAELLRRAKFYDLLGFKSGEKQRAIAERVSDYLEGLDDEEPAAGEGASRRRRKPLGEMGETDLDELVRFVAQAANTIYASRGKDPLWKGREVIDRWENDPSLRRTLLTRWSRVVGVFTVSPTRRPLSEVIRAFLEDRAIVILDLSLYDRRQPYFLINEILSHVRHLLYSRFRDGTTSNGMIVFDVAHYYCPHDPGDNDDARATRDTIAESVRTTRKYGIGWFFINQRMTQFSTAVLSQLHIKVFGFGLNTGADLQYVEEFVGREAAALYRGLPDPKKTGMYPFLLAGPLVAIGTSNAPFVVRGFTHMDEIFAHNRHVLKDRPAGK